MMFQWMPETVKMLLSEEQMQDLRAARNKTRLPQSLNALAIKSVSENFTRFIDVPDSPLKCLPNTIVQQLLSKIASDVKNQKMLIPLPQLLQVLVLLVNPFVTELDCTVFDSSYPKDKKFNNYLVKHALANCPRIRKISLRYERPQAYRNYKWDKDVLPVECFKRSWNNLTTMIVSERDFFCNEDTMMFLQENYPNIEVLSVGIAITGPTTQTMLDHLSNMKRLHTFNVDVQSISASVSYQEIPKFIVDVAGAVPSLRNFDFGGGRNNDSKFIDLFGEKYPNKKLLVNKLRIEKGLKRKWPKNLSVKHLIIDGYWSGTEIENLSTIECTLDLTVNCKLAQQMYQVLVCIGGLVKKLAIEDTNKRLEVINVEYDTEFILERVLAACPNLEHFKYKTSMSVVQDPNYNLRPAAFKNYKSFVIIGSDEKYQEEVVLQKVYRNFLIGTEVCESLEGLNYKQLQTLVQVALAYPESLQQLRELHITPSSYTKWADLEFYDEMDEPFDKYDKCFYELLTCCHKLERIFRQVPFEGEQETRMNCYLATIQSIDPHFIQKHAGQE